MLASTYFPRLAAFKYNSKEKIEYELFDTFLLSFFLFLQLLQLIMTETETMNSPINIDIFMFIYIYRYII